MKKKPVLFTSNTNIPKIHSLSNHTEVNGFELQRKHLEKVSRMLENASQAVITDVRVNKPKKPMESNIHAYSKSS